MYLHIISLNSWPSLSDDTLRLPCLWADQAPGGLEKSLRQRNRKVWALEVGTVTFVKARRTRPPQLQDNSMGT